MGDSVGAGKLYPILSGQVVDIDEVSGMQGLYMLLEGSMSLRRRWIPTCSTSPMPRPTVHAALHTCMNCAQSTQSQPWPFRPGNWRPWLVHQGLVP